MEDINKKNIANERIRTLGQAVWAFILGALCACASLPYSVMPFGIALCCADKHSKAVNISVFIGTAAAYILQNSQPVYLAAILLSIPLKIIVSYFIPRKNARYAAPVTTLISLLFLYVTIYIQFGMLTFDLITGLAGIISGCIFCFAASVAMKVMFLPSSLYGAMSEKETVYFIMFFSIMLTAFSSIDLMGLSIARIAAVLLTVFFTAYTGAGFGVCTAILTAAACAIGQPDNAYLTSSYALAAIAASFFNSKKKYFSVFVFTGTFALSALYFKGSIETLAAITETSIGCTLYLILPQNATDLLAIKGKLTSEHIKNGTDKRIQELICSKLNNASTSMQRIAKALTKKNEDSNMSIYENMREIEERICKNCRQSAKCWGENYSVTRDVFNKSANTILKKLRFDEGDLPEYFIDTCIHTDKLYSAFKRLSEESRNEIIMQRSVQINRKIMAAQYDGISAYIQDICNEVYAISDPDETTFTKIQDYFISLGIPKQNVTVYYDSRKAIHIEANIISEKRLYERKIATELSDIIGRNIVCDSIIKQENTYRLKFIQQEKYSLTVAQTNRNKDGERVCGDSFTTFKSKSYRQILALADGMGSGNEADRLSSLTLDILKNLLENGFGEEKACSLVNSTLLLGGDGQSFSTLDMASIDLFNGRADFYKLGAAPTLILRDGKAYEIFCASLPAGILGESKAEHRNCKLRDGDMIIMLSDGVDIDQKMLSVCKDNAKENPITLCERIMETATVDGKADDDMTIAIAKVNLKKSA